MFSRLLHTALGMSVESELEGDGRERPLWYEDEQCSTGMEYWHTH